MPKRVLVTGASGFLGRHAARAWSRQGHEIVGLGHGAWLESEWRAWGLSRWVEGDVNLHTLREVGLNPAIIIHCAGSGSVGFSIEHPAADFERSVGTLLAVLEFVRLTSLDTRLVLPSSAAVYGRVDRTPIPVDAPLGPVSPYGVHKRISEDLCRSYASHFGLSIAIVRFFSLYGPGLRKQLLWEACERFSRGEASFMGTGREIRDWLQVEDAADLILAAADRADPSCPVANGGTGSGLRVQELLELLRQSFPQAPPLFFAGSGKPGDPAAYEADIRESRAWGWEPRVAWHEGIRGYADWYLGRPR